MKSKLYVEKITMMGADIGPENPLPDVKSLPDLHDKIAFDASIPEEESKYYNYGRVNGILPYRIQDGYNRDKQLRDYEGFVLENDFIKAVFFPQFGGRLWSLLDKKTGRDLVHRNPVFQPANLALRNAWFSGGVEWNIGMTGHTPYTLSPLFASTGKLADGTPVLRMYEWERIRQVSYQIDAFLPAGSRFLFVRVRLCNTRAEEVPIYWWSNTAVNETPGTRVLAPAAKAFSFDYSRIIRKIPVPVHEGIDKSYTTRVPHALDLFFDIQEGQRKWEAVLDEKGGGLIQTSTDLLQGRKLFLWGNGPGGKRWQEFLARPGEGYLEIQAGLANTQMEHLPMPANACWQWLEAYGPMQADPQIVHGEWAAAGEHVNTRLEEELPRSKVDGLLKQLDSELTTAWEPVQLGSGWAALELARRGAGDQFGAEIALFAPSSTGAAQAPWLELLHTGSFPDSDPAREPASYLTQAEWIPLLEQAVSTGKSRHWHALYQLGVMYCAAGEFEKAEEAYRESNRLTPNAWSVRGLAMLELLKGDEIAASTGLLEAARQLPILPLAIECGRLLIQAGRYSDFVDFYSELEPALQTHGRLRTMRAHAAVMLDDFGLAHDILRSGLQVADIREGEVLLSDIWIMLYMRKIAKEEGIAQDDALRERVLREHPIPEELDFRMRT
ncbi:MAG: DUF5107 domain-containing protein [Oscillospiraceae bacterium]